MCNQTQVLQTAIFQAPLSPKAAEETMEKANIILPLPDGLTQKSDEFIVLTQAAGILMRTD